MKWPIHTSMLAVRLIVAAVLAGIAPVALAQTTVIQEWNFTGGSLLSQSGTNATFLGTVADTDGNDQYKVTRGDGNSGNVSLGTLVNASTADLLTLSVTLSDFNFSPNPDEYFGVNFRSGSTTVAALRFDGQTAASSGSIDRIRLSGIAVAGVALNAVSSASPITYGLTLNFADNSYTYWIGTADSDGSTWVSRFANHTGAIDLTTTSIDGLQWGIQSSGAGSHFNLDQVLVTSTLLPVPEPSAAVLLGLGLVGILISRARRRI